MERAGADLTGGTQDTQRDGQVEASALLGQVRRGQIDGDAPEWKLEASVEQGAAHAVLALPHRHLRQPDDRQGRQPARQVDLHGHQGGRDTLPRTAVQNAE